MKKFINPVSSCLILFFFTLLPSHSYAQVKVWIGLSFNWGHQTEYYMGQAEVKLTNAETGSSYSYMIESTNYSMNWDQPFSIEPGQYSIETTLYLGGKEWTGEGNITLTESDDDLDIVWYYYNQTYDHSGADIEAAAYTANEYVILYRYY